MKCLRFSETAEARNGKRMRAARFERRSGLPVSAACVVASSVRETLSALFGTPAAVRLLEPSIPAPDAWPAISGRALLYRTRGNVADAAIVLRPREAVALAAALFGEAPPDGERELSPLERDVLDRLAGAIAPSLQSVCGLRDRDALEPAHTIAGYTTYFEILLERPVEARIGIALSRDPQPEPRARLTVDDLSNVALTVVARLELDRTPARELTQWKNGTLLPLREMRGSVLLAGKELARGTCGVRGGKYAFALESKA